MFSNLWTEPPKPTMKEILREQKRTAHKSQRGIQREQRALDRQEKKLVADIKKNAQQGNTSAAKQLAREVVRTRGTQQKMQMAHTHLGSLGMRGAEMKANMAMTSAI